MPGGHFLSTIRVLTCYSPVRQRLIHTHFIEEKTEAQRCSWTCSKSQSTVWRSPYSNPGCLAVNEGMDEKVRRSLAFEVPKVLCDPKGCRAPLPTLVAWAQDHSFGFHFQRFSVLGAWDTCSYSKTAPSQIRGLGRSPSPSSSLGFPSHKRGNSTAVH